MPEIRTNGNGLATTGAKSCNNAPGSGAAPIISEMLQVCPPQTTCSNANRCSAYWERRTGALGANSRSKHKETLAYVRTMSDLREVIYVDDKLGLSGDPKSRSESRAHNVRIE
jgi:hypothetical protein